MNYRSKLENEETCNKTEEFHFPLYIYRDFFNLKDSLKRPEELKLYSAFEAILEDNFHEANLMAQQVYSETDDIPFKITCLYVMCRCCFYLKKYPVMMKHTLEMNRLLAEDFPFKKEMEPLLIDIESYYKGFDSLLHASFDSLMNIAMKFIHSLPQCHYIDRSSCLLEKKRILILLYMN